MPKINLPIDSNSAVPNINNLSGEATKYNELEMTFPRTTTGQVSWTAYPSGIVYNTADYSSNVNIYNKGEDGLLNLLLYLYGGEDGWIVVADDFNKVSISVIDNLTTETTGGALDAHQGYVLNTTKLDKTDTAADSIKLNGLSANSYQLKNTIYTNIQFLVSSWVDSTTYTGYPYQATYSTNIISTPSNVPLASFNQTSLGYGVLSPFVYLGTNSVTIYASAIPSGVVTISTLVVMV